MTSTALAGIGGLVAAAALWGALGAGLGAGCGTNWRL
jgi:hypothetical protein